MQRKSPWRRGRFRPARRGGVLWSSASMLVSDSRWFERFSKWRVSPPAWPVPRKTELLRGRDSWLRPLLLNRFCRLLKLREFLFPLGSLGGFAPGVVEL